MLDQRKSEIWKALGIGPQWIERDELAKAAEEAVKAKAEAAAASQNYQPQASTTPPAAASFVNHAPQSSEAAPKPAANNPATTPSRVTSIISDRNAPPPRSTRPEPAAKPAYRSAS
ncbi:MAG TPA: arginine biosynthesis protein ArgJ, partial [Sutterellaceae bacterium]|nr:arginine biosynthesis protein ArgJ [Sutterellaceae bacterium]